MADINEYGRPVPVGTHAGHARSQKSPSTPAPRNKASKRVAPKPLTDYEWLEGINNGTIKIDPGSTYNGKPGSGWNILNGSGGSGRGGPWY